MKAIIENYPIFNENAGSLADKTRNNQMTEFMTILKMVTKSKSEYGIRMSISELPKFEHFVLLIDANHFSAYQVFENENVSPRILFCDFSGATAPAKFTDFYYAMQPRMSTRLSNFCSLLSERTGLLLKDVTIQLFIRSRNIGKKSFYEFDALRTEFINR